MTEGGKSWLHASEFAQRMLPTVWRQPLHHATHVFGGDDLICCDVLGLAHHRPPFSKVTAMASSSVRTGTTSSPFTFGSCAAAELGTNNRIGRDRLPSMIDCPSSASKRSLRLRTDRARSTSP